jgi:thiosulfate dehydrogenase [quinone] large subunit
MLASFTEPHLTQLVTRIGLGTSMSIHDRLRIPNLSGFVDNLTAGFVPIPLPDLLTQASLYGLPFLILGSGIFILQGGSQSKCGYFLGGLTVGTLMFGTTLKQDWVTAGSQLIYITVFYLALRGLDNLGRSRRQ